MKSAITILVLLFSGNLFAMKSLSNDFTPGNYTLYGKLTCFPKKKECEVKLYPGTTRQLTVKVVPTNFRRALLYSGAIIEGRGVIKVHAKGRKAKFEDFQIIKVAPEYKAFDIVYTKDSSKK